MWNASTTKESEMNTKNDIMSQKERGLSLQCPKYHAIFLTQETLDLFKCLKFQNRYSQVSKSQKAGKVEVRACE